MKYFLFILLALNSSLLSGQEKRPFSFGLRTGAIHDAYSYKAKNQITDKNNNIRNGFSHQIFLNYAFGKKERWMAETSIGYYSYSREEWESYFDALSNVRYAYNFFKTNVYSLNLELRYCFVHSKRMNWKHYAGATIAINRYNTKIRGFDNVHDVHVFDRRSSTENTWYNYTGIQYYGKLDLPYRFSVQYLAGYSFSSTRFAPEAETGIVGEPTTHRLNVNFGFGYQL